jgi:hypothetical protein
MRFVLLLALGMPLLAADEARDILRRATEADQRNEKLARNYTFLERVSRRSLEKDGRVKRTQIRTYDVTLSEGTPYQRLIEIDNQPLPADKERKEQEKLRKINEERRKESPQQRAKREADWEKERAKDREFVKELLAAMDFRLAGEEEIAGRKAWVIEATPHPGYRPRSAETKFLAKTRGRIWIDQQDYLAPRIEAEMLDDVSLGGFLAKVHRGSRFYIDMVRVNNEVWLPKKVEAQISARILVARFRERFEVTFRDFKKFQADTRIITAQPVAGP